MAVEAVVFDIGETLVDETGMWIRIAEAAGVTPFTLMAALGATIVEARPHNDVWELLGIDPPSGAWRVDDWYPDAAPCIARLRDAGFRVCAVGNTPASFEPFIAERLEVLGSSESWGVEKPDAAFFARIVDVLSLPPEKIAYVGDRVDNDVLPAMRAGMVAVHVKRGPWGYLQERPAGAALVDSLDELPAAIA
ncbi:MAG TPA: HAD family hydrolase [Gaiellaceae bacterium]|jgi:FMN phosphatase YigB (HAD superfamily)|nr:HAD family hydrolase [Gaiellaceae bacterium]